MHCNGRQSSVESHVINKCRCIHKMQPLCNVRKEVIWHTTIESRGGMKKASGCERNRKEREREADKKKEMTKGQWGKH